ncbi:hypothetical protein HWV62_39347 [Athelia sp. TMB]|nr:hypothetical protein HWV62_39347 [Athelia sp. TMB]
MTVNTSPSIFALSDPEEPLKCYAVPYGVLNFAVSFFLICYNTSNHFGYNLWTFWIPQEDEIRGPLAFCVKKTRFSYRTVLSMRDLVRLIGCYVAFAVSTYTMSDAFVNMLRISLRLYRRILRSTPHFLVSLIVIFAFLLWGALELAGPIVGLIGLHSIAAARVKAHPSLRILAWVLLGVGLALFLSLATAMSLGSFTGQERLLLQKEGAILRRWLEGVPDPASSSGEGGTKDEKVGKDRKSWIESLKYDDEDGGDAKDKFQSVRRSAGVLERIVTIIIGVLGWGIILAVIFEGWYIDWMLAVVTENIYGVPHHRTLGIVYSATIVAYTLI